MKRLIPIFTVVVSAIAAFDVVLWANPSPVHWALVDTLAPVRAGYKSAYDRPHDKIILFGGQDTLGQMPDDIWEFSIGSSCYWNPIVSPGPEGRVGHGIFYDTLSQSLFLFGGRNQSGQYLNDTWIWQDGQWTRIDTSACPSPRADFGFTYNPYNLTALLFGGIGEDTLYGDTWEWTDSTGWLQLDVSGPSPRKDAGLVSCNYGWYCILYGGQNADSSQVFSDVWLWDWQNWATYPIVGEPPSPRIGFAMGNCQEGTMLFGGQDVLGSDSLLGDIWWVGYSSYYQHFEWFPDIYPLNPPPSRSLAIIVQFHNWYIALIGGTDGNRILRDVWAYPLEDPNYRVGDINFDWTFNGLDVVYAVNYFKGGPPPTYMWECKPCNAWYVNGDVNGSCTFNGLDVTYMVAYLKGGPSVVPCPDCPPAY